MSAGAVILLLLVLVAIDPRLREEISAPFSSRPSVALSSAGSRIRDAGNALAKAARDKSMANAPLLIFGLSAAVLVLFMLRT
jgi:hypothetical protein